MPIRPERRGLYPGNWRAISELIRENADDRCQECGVCNKAVGYRDALGAFVGVPGIDRPTVLAVLRSLRGADARLTKIVLTVHHRDGDPTNNRRENLVALCQRCHLRADRQLREQADAARLACANCWEPIADERACWRNAADIRKAFCSKVCSESWGSLNIATVTRESLAEAPRGPIFPDIDAEVRGRLASGELRTRRTCAECRGIIPEGQAATIKDGFPALRFCSVPCADKFPGQGENRTWTDCQTADVPLPDLLARFCQSCWRPLAFAIQDGKNHYCSMECAITGPRPWPNSEAAAAPAVLASVALAGVEAAAASVLLAHRRQDSPETAERATMNREGDDHGAD